MLDNSLWFNKIYCANCMDMFEQMSDNSVNLTLTDIPYGTVNQNSNGLRILDKGDANKVTFDLQIFLQQINRVTNNTIIVFCGKEQFSFIYSFFYEKQQNRYGTVRQIVWDKTNPSPMNGRHVFLSGIENAVWFKKRGAPFNANCRNSTFRFPNGVNKIHPTEKNHLLLKDLIAISSNEGDLVFDPCCGSGSHLLVAKQMNRNFLGFELSNIYAETAMNRVL